MKLDRNTVAQLSLPRGNSELIVFDDKLKGFGVRLRAGGKRTWIIQYRVGTKQRRKTLGSVNSITATKARETAEHDLAAVTLGADPQAKKKEEQARASVTFKTVAARILKHQEAELKPRSYEQVETHLTKHWAPFNEKPIHTITRRDIAARLGEIAEERGPFAANRARSNLSTFFGWAMSEGLAEVNPVVGTNRQTAEVARDRVLTDAELVAIWNNSQDDDYGRITRLLILTAQRREEVGAMARAELAVADRKWTIPGARTKNGVTHEVPLSDSAIVILKEALAREGREEREALFGEGAGGFAGWSKSKAALDERIAKAAETDDDKKKKKKEEEAKSEPWRLHDIRRTVATRMADLGVLPHVIEAVLNHISGHKAGVAGIYNRSVYAAEKRQALDLWAAHVEDAGGKNRSISVAPTHGVHHQAQFCWT